MLHPIVLVVLMRHIILGSFTVLLVCTLLKSFFFQGSFRSYHGKRTIEEGWCWYWECFGPIRQKAETKYFGNLSCYRTRKVCFFVQDIALSRSISVTTYCVFTMKS